MPSLRATCRLPEVCHPVLKRGPRSHSGIETVSVREAFLPHPDTFQTKIGRVLSSQVIANRFEVFK